MLNNHFKLLMITNDPVKAKILSESGVDRIFVDLEIIGKTERQGHLNTVISRHNIKDVERVKKSISKGEVLVRVNPLNKNSKDEIDRAIDYGADIIMLPMFRMQEEVERISDLIEGRVKFIPLIETKKAVENITEIVNSEGVDEFFIGLNDLHLDFNLKFMFQHLENGILDSVANNINQKKIKFGFGGIARIGHGVLPAEQILTEHSRLHSSSVILSRTFCNESDFNLSFLCSEVNKIKNLMADLSRRKESDIYKDKINLDKKIKKIVKDLD